VAEHLAGADHVTAIGDRQRLPLAMVGDQDRDAAVAKSADDLLNRMDGDRVDAGERLVEEDDPRLGDQAAGNFEPPLLAPRDVVRLRAADLHDVELLEQLLAAKQRKRQKKLRSEQWRFEMAMAG